MNPTSHLRFVVRKTEGQAEGGSVRWFSEARILQQWWSDAGFDGYISGTPDGNPGQWRDVPQVEDKP